MAKGKNILEKSEKQEIVSDVKEAFDKAKNNSSYAKRKNKLIAILSVIIVLVLFAFSIYWYLSSNPKTIFVHSINEFFERLDNNIVSFNNHPSYGNVYTEYETLTTDKHVNKYSFSFDYAAYDKNCVLLNDLYDKYICFDDDFVYSDKDIKTMTKSIGGAFLKAINGYKISNSKVKITKKSEAAYKTTLSLKKNDISTLLDRFFDQLVKDENFKVSYQNMFNNNNFENWIETIRNDFKNMFSDSDSVLISIYTNGFKRSFVKLELVELKQGKQKVLSITNKIKNKYNIAINDEQNMLTKEYFVSVKKGNNSYTYDFDIKQNKNKTLKLKGKIKIVEKNDKSIKTMTDALDYSKLSLEEKQKIDDKLSLFELLIKEIIVK